jgi:hypothetical protein
MRVVTVNADGSALIFASATELLDLRLEGRIAQGPAPVETAPVPASSPLDVFCRWCKATRGTECKQPAGRIVGGFHLERRAAFILARSHADLVR